MDSLFPGFSTSSGIGYFLKSDVKHGGATRTNIKIGGILYAFDD